MLLHDNEMLNVNTISKGTENLEEFFLVFFCFERRVNRLDVDLYVSLMFIKIFQILQIAIKINQDAAGFLIALGV